MNIALEAIDRIKTTASLILRAFLIEVMGRRCGYLALMAGIAGGAEIILIPEIEVSPEEVATAMRASYERGKPHAIAVVAERARAKRRGPGGLFLRAPGPPGLRPAPHDLGPHAAWWRPHSL